jgi:dTDP-4-amino-4,6-dideoxygalactose transaminase
MKIIKLSSAWIGEEEISAAMRVLKSQILNMGIEVKLFENELHEFFNRKDSKVTCVSSCTAALQLAVQGCGIKPGDEVLVPTYTFVATFQAVKAAGGIPIPCDVDIDDAFLNIDDAKSRLTNKTKAIVPVLFAGCSSKINDLYQLAFEKNLKVIEDAAHSFGDENIANRDGVLCFSFDAIKNITCSDGGAVVTSDDEVTENVKNARLLGVIGDTETRFSGKRTWEPNVKDQGWRYHMNNLCAAIGRAQLAKFSQIKERRQKYANMYLDAFAKIKEIRLLPINTKTAVPHIFPIIIENGKRDDLKAFLFENGIEAGVQYKPNHLLDYFNMGYDLPNAMKVYHSILSIPLYPRLNEEQVFYIIDKIKQFFEK